MRFNGYYLNDLDLSNRPLRTMPEALQRALAKSDAMQAISRATVADQPGTQSTETPPVVYPPPSSGMDTTKLLMYGGLAALALFLVMRRRA